MKVEDRITLLTQTLSSGLVRLTIERQTALRKELDLLNAVALKGGAGADLGDIYQSGQNWVAVGCSGSYESEEKARLRSIQLTAQAAGIEMPGANAAESAALLMPGPLAEVLRDLAATGAGARLANQLMAAASQLDCLQNIFDEIDGQHWSADTLNNISNHLSVAGFDVGDITEMANPDCDEPGV